MSSDQPPATPPPSDGGLKMDPEQFAQVLALLRPKPTASWDLDRIIKLIQVATVAGAVAAAFYAWRTHRREEEKFPLQVAREKNGLAIDQITLAKAGKARLQWDWDVELRRALGPAPANAKAGVYQMTLRLKGTNISDRPLCVSYNMLRLFVAPPLQLGHSRGLEVLAINPPPTDEDTRSTVAGPKPLEWKAACGVLLHSVPRWKETTIGQATIKKAGVEPVVGGAIGTIGTGEAVETTADFVVQGSDESWVGFTLEVGIDDEEIPWTFGDYRRLGQLSPARSERDTAPQL